MDRKNPILRTNCGLIRGCPTLHLDHGVFAGSPFPVMVLPTHTRGQFKFLSRRTRSTSFLILRCAFAPVTAEHVNALDCHRILEKAVLRLHYLLFVHDSFERQHGSYGDMPENCCVLPSGAYHYLQFKVKVSGIVAKS